LRYQPRQSAALCLHANLRGNRALQKASTIGGGTTASRRPDVTQIALVGGRNRRERGLCGLEASNVSNSLTTLIVLVTLIHVAAFVVMIVIRVRRNEVEGTAGKSEKITACAVCGEPATHRRYDGLDPNEHRDPYTGRAYSTDMTHYRPLCAAH
jgi:hypothetical protein